MAFYVGQKVVCIDTFTPTNDETTPQIGIIYTIRDIVPSGRYSGEAKIRVVEIRNTPRNYKQGFKECFFSARQFRPVVERKTDISIFTEMLTPKTRELVLTDAETGNGG